MKRLSLWLLAVSLAVVPNLAKAQIIVIDRPHPRPVPAPPDYTIRSIDVHADIKDQIAKVQLAQVFQNTGSSTIEASFLLPLPADAAISELTLLVDGKELTGQLLDKDEARRIYESIVRKQRDPALLEYMGQGLFQTSVFPIPAKAERKVEIRYTQLLRKDNGLVDFLLPVGSAKAVQKPIEKFRVDVRIEASEPLKTVYSPTHAVDIERPDNRHAVCKLSLENVRSADDLRLFYSTESGPVGINLVSFRPSDDEAGYFMLLASPEIQTSDAPSVPKTVVFVVDRSGSMSGEKIEQVREALKFFIRQLKPEDTFNIVAYDSDVESFRPELQRVDDETRSAALDFAAGLYSGGSTNIDAALKTALTMLTDHNRPSYVLFLTDGLPTAGEQNELKIVANAEQANQAKARVFSFGVGYDVNSRLLDRLSRDLRGQSVYVRPNESIEAHVAALYKKIGTPLLTDLDVKFDVEGRDDSSSGITRIYPNPLTDLFAGEQLVLVGRYQHPGDVKVTITGTVGDEKKTFATEAVLVDKSNDDTQSFVEKIWATRRIGEIIDELDLKGHNQELVNELVELSKKHGIMTPYTSFLANEDVELADTDGLRRRAVRDVEQLQETAGESAFYQRQLKGQFKQSLQVPALSSDLNRAAGGGIGGGGAGSPRSLRLGALGRPQAAALSDEAEPGIETVRAIGRKTFFRKQDRWQDSTVTPDEEAAAVRITQFSPEYFELASAEGGRWSKFLTFDEAVVVNLEGKTYRIDPPTDEN